MVCLMFSFKFQWKLLINICGCLAISLAIKRDGSSGGVVRLGVLNHTGSIQRKLVLGDELPKFYDNVLVQNKDGVSGEDAPMA